MLANENPGTCGVAARLATKPGTQKPTPPSSAEELVGVNTTIVPATGIAATLATNFNRTNDRQNFSVKNQERPPLATSMKSPPNIIFCVLILSNCVRQPTREPTR